MSLMQHQPTCMQLDLFVLDKRGPVKLHSWAAEVGCGARAETSSYHSFYSSSVEI